MQMQTGSNWRAGATVVGSGLGAPREAGSATGHDTAADNRVVILEEALIEYIGRFGLTEKARAVFKLAPNDLTGALLRRR